MVVVLLTRVVPLNVRIEFQKPFPQWGSVSKLFTLDTI